MGLLVLIICLGGIFLYSKVPFIPTFFINDEEISKVVQQLFDDRNRAMLQRDFETLTELYDRSTRLGQWAYEHEEKKTKYLHKWSEKQGIKFFEISPKVITRSVKTKNQGFTLNLLVSTTYKYIYENEPDHVNQFRIGTYHVLDIIPKDEVWVIAKEWYTDPFADSLHIDELKSADIKQYILQQQPPDLSNLDERRKNAVAYADQYCGAAGDEESGYSYNKKYKNYNPLGGDCANFASQILYEGGKFRKTGGWNYDKGGSRAWVNAQGFKDYMLNSGRASLIARGTYEKVYKAAYKFKPGDFVAYEKKGKIVHISVVTGVDSKGYPLVNCHNTDRYRVPWDLGWSDKGIKFWLVHVHF
ncbi:MAG: amidase domain-containing protein [Bacillota bacterium]